MDEQKIKNLIREWYEKKALRETEPIFKFLCLWICFNAWLAYRSQKDRDCEMLDWLKQETNSDLITVYENARRTKSFDNLLKSFVRMFPIHDSRGMRNSIKINDENDRGNIIKGIYQVRCNLFHGGKEANNFRDQQLVKVCADILEQWIGKLIDLW